MYLELIYRKKRERMLSLIQNHIKTPRANIKGTPWLNMSHEFRSIKNTMSLSQKTYIIVFKKMQLQAANGKIC